MPFWVKLLATGVVLIFSAGMYGAQTGADPNGEDLSDRLAVWGFGGGLALALVSTIVLIWGN